MLPFFLASALCITSSHLVSLLTFDPCATTHDTKYLYFASWSLHGPISGWLSINDVLNYLFTWLRLALAVAPRLSLAVSRGLSSCGTQAQLSRGLRNPPGAGTEPASPALADGFSTTAPPGRSINILFISRISL